jgi:hypothetical protein
MPRTFNIQTFTDASIDTARLISPPGYSDGMVFLGGLRAWTMVEHAATFLHMQTCSVCEGLPLIRRSYCLGCDRCTLDGRVAYPGLGVDEAPDPTWTAEATVYAPDPSLEGGVQPAKKRKPSSLKARLARRRSSKRTG